MQSPSRAPTTCMARSTSTCATAFWTPGNSSTSRSRASRGIILAHRSGVPIKKDKAFFFFNYEGLRASTGLTNRAVVPTSLPDLFKARGMTQNQSGQWVGHPYGPSGAEVPINSVTQSIFSLYPLAQSSAQCPNISGINLLQGTGLYCSSEKQIGNQDYVLGRVDYKLGDKDTLFARYARESAYQVLHMCILRSRDIRNLTGNATSTSPSQSGMCFRPREPNEARFGVVRLFTETANGGKTGTGTALQQFQAGRIWNFHPARGLHL